MKALKRECVFVTGSDTGVGKTVLAALLTRALKARGREVVALKPVCTGGREDARTLADAMGNPAAWRRINPWAFRRPLAPVLAARLEGRTLGLREVLHWIRPWTSGEGWLIVEGAGGLLTPLGTDFSARELIGALRCRTLVVVPNRLGAVNQGRLVFETLPASVRRRTAVVLTPVAGRDSSQSTNRALLEELVRPAPVFQCPRVRLAGKRRGVGQGLAEDPEVRALVAWLGL